MVVIRIGPRTLAFLGIGLALIIGLVVGSVRPADFVLAANRSAPAPGSVAAEPFAQAPGTLTLEQANRAIQGAIAYCQEHGYWMGFVVVDASGSVVATARMDGPGSLTPAIVQGKALTSAALGRPGGAVAEGLSTNPGLWHSVIGMGRGFVLAQRALPIVVGGVRVGAMGGGGGTGQQDEDAVRAGLQAAGLD